MLKNGCKTFEAHTGVNAGRGQRRDRTGFVHVELHEHVVPDFDKTVTIFIGAAGWAAGNVRAVVVKDFGARTARARVGHHPEVVGLVAAALVVANADDAVLFLHPLRRPASFDKNAFPNGMGLVVFHVDGGVQLVGG